MPALMQAFQNPENPMALETAPYINGLAPANPPGSDRIHQGDDHIRLIKSALKNTFPNLTGPVTLTQAAINALPALALPVGIITAWWGSADTCPSGWAVCNGQTVARSDGSGNITLPDLQSRVIVGVDDSLTVGAIFGAPMSSGLTTGAAGLHGHTGTASSAGEHTHGGSVGSTALSVDQIPAHTHTVATGTSEGDNPSNFTNGNSSTGSPVTTSSAGNGAGHTHSISAGGGHTHTIALDGGGDHSHTIPIISTLQPSMALHHIMKI